MPNSCHCSNCGALISLHESAYRTKFHTFCDSECYHEHEQDNVGYAVQLNLPIKDDENQLELEGV